MAIPNPERELTRLRQVLGKKQPALLVLIGISDFFRGEAFELAQAAIPASADLRCKDGQEDSDGSELHDLLGAGLFGSGTWLCVRRGDAWLKQHGSDLEGLLGRIAGGCGLLLEIKKLDKRTKIARALKESGELFEFRDLYAEPYDRSRSPLDSEMVSWLVQRSRQMKVPVSSEAAFLLMSSVGQQPTELLAELRRLQDALRQSGVEVRKPLGPRELSGHLTISFESTPFEFAEALLAFDRRRASRSLRAMYARGVRSKDGSRVEAGGLFPFVTSWLMQSLDKVHRARCQVDAGQAFDAVCRDMGVRVFVDRFREQVRLNPEPRLRAGLGMLMECQRDLRRTGEDAELLLERFLSAYFSRSEEVA
ncbi:MAG: DNA polymerase III subunit delta [Planctomycetota bacterium]|jgi:DNA polymerase III delta subunit